MLPFFVRIDGSGLPLRSVSRQRRDSKSVMQRIANPSSPVRLWVAPPGSPLQCKRKTPRSPGRFALCSARNAPPQSGDAVPAHRHPTRRAAMVTFEWIILLLLGAAALATLAGRLGAPYPTFLALGGVALAFISPRPDWSLDPPL